MGITDLRQVIKISRHKVDTDKLHARYTPCKWSMCDDYRIPWNSPTTQIPSEHQFFLLHYSRRDNSHGLHLRWMMDHESAETIESRPRVYLSWSIKMGARREMEESEKVAKPRWNQLSDDGNSPSKIISSIRAGKGSCRVNPMTQHNHRIRQRQAHITKFRRANSAMNTGSNEWPRPTPI